MLQPYKKVLLHSLMYACAPATSGQISYYWVELGPEFHCPTHIRILGNCAHIPVFMFTFYICFVSKETKFCM